MRCGEYGGPPACSHSCRPFAVSQAVSQMENFELDGRQIRVSKSTPRSGGGGGGGFGGGGGYGGGRGGETPIWFHAPNCCLVPSPAPLLPKSLRTRRPIELDFSAPAAHARPLRSVCGPLIF